jgi:predicted transcriptional regulator
MMAAPSRWLIVTRPRRRYRHPDRPACAICPRIRCPQRAAAPAGRTLTVNETQKTISPYPFLGG